MHNHASGTVERARKLRREMSLPQVLLWRVLKTKPMGLKFRTQHPIVDNVADFYCHAARTVFEIDGISHDMGDQPEFDVQRDLALTSAGVQVVRIAAAEVLKDVDGSAESMVQLCLDKAASPARERPTGATR